MREFVPVGPPWEWREMICPPMQRVACLLCVGTATRGEEVRLTIDSQR